MNWTLKCNPDTLRAYANIFRMQKDESKEASEIAKAVANALAFQADYIEKGPYELELI